VPSPESRSHRSRSGGADQCGVPVDQPPAILRTHSVARVRLAMSQHQAAQVGAGGTDQILVPGQSLADAVSVGGEQLCGGSGVRSQAGGHPVRR